MKTIGLFYSFNTKNSKIVAEKIKHAFGNDKIEGVNAEEVDEKTFLSFDNLIIGAPTWWDGELPNYWDEFVPALEEMDLHGKVISLFGLGDQVKYADNFGDAIGTLAILFESRGAKIVGATSTDGYNFHKSKAVRGDKFVGVMLDMENQAGFTDVRIKDWVKELKKEFK